MRVLEALQRFGAAPDEAGSHDLTLELTEHSKRTVPFGAPKVSVAYGALYSLLEPAINAGLVDVGVGGRGTGQYEVILSTSSIIGFRTVQTPDGGRVFVSVRPKIADARVLELATMAGLLPDIRGPKGTLVGASDRGELFEWLARTFLQTLLLLLQRGGLRPLHAERTEVLRNRVRGRVAVRQYATNWAAGRPHHIPCTFPVLDLDNDVNRYLRWAIHLLARAVYSLPTGWHSRRALLSELETMEERFHGVAVQPPVVGFRPTAVLPKNMHHYAQALAVASIIIDNIVLDARAGATAAAAVAIDMNIVFERAFLAAARAVEPRVVGQTRWSVPLHDSGGTVAAFASYKPDVVVPETADCSGLVVDTKWKDVLTGAEHSEDLVQVAAEARLRTTDLFQITAYGLEYLRRNRTTRVAAALVYPALQDAAHLGMTVTCGNAKIEVALIGWNIANSCWESFRDVWDQLRSLAGEKEEVAPAEPAHP